MIPFPVFIKVFSLFLEVFAGIWLFSHLFPARRFRYRSFFLVGYFFLYFILILVEEYEITKWVDDGYAIYLLMHSLMLMIFALLFYEGQFIFKVFLPLTFVSLITLTRFPATLLCRLLLWAIPPFGALMPVVSNLMPSLLLLLIALFMLHFRLDTTKTYPVSYYYTMIITPLLNMTVITLLKNYYSVVPYVDLIGFFTMMIELLIYYMIWQSTTEYTRRTKLQLMQQQQSYQDQHMTELKDIVTEYHRLRHDMKNHFACMDQLLSQGKYNMLKEYFYSMSKDLYAIDNQIETGNEIINQVINIKYATAHKLQIPMEIQISVPSRLNIPNHLLCSVLSNLLDNAIEASSKVNAPAITIKMKMVKDYLSLSVENRIEPGQRESALSHRTTKSNPQMHGLGLQIVQEVVRRYNGISTYEVIDNRYVASIMLELGSQKAVVS